ncbi:MAG: FadR family transcriptional regulator [Hyphomicrobiaceae bacterium]|nr:MAG: FadR family transcriptional regulator [Hyphomicrobiaceae bacterium]
MSRRFPRIERAPAYRLLADALAAEILAGRLRPGEVLPTEARLCEEFGVQRTTVREGMRALEEAGMLSRADGGKRMRVSRPSAALVGNQIRRAMILNQVTYGELCDALLVIDPALARAAAARCDAATISALERNCTETESLLRAGRSISGLDVAFHGLIAEASGNRALILARQPLLDLLDPAFERVLSAVSNAGRRLLQAHRKIVAAMREGDPDDAEGWMTKHIRDFRRGFELQQIPLDQPVTLPRSTNHRSQG